MARLTIAWVKEYAKTNGIFLVKTSNGYCVQYQRLIDELTYEDSVGYRAVFKTLKETKDWIDDQNPVDVLGIDKEVAKEIYEDAKNFSDKVDRDMGVDREEENYNIPELDPRYDGKFWNVESIGMSYQEDYTPLEWYEKLIKTGRDKHAEWWLNQHPEIKNVEVREYAQSIFPYLEITDNKSVYDAIMNWRDSNRFIKEGEEFLPALPLWELNHNNELDSVKFHKLATEYLAYIERIERKEFNEVREYAENCGYTLLELSECEYCNFTLCSTNGVGEFTALVDVVEAIKDGRMLNKEFSALPLLKSKSLKITPCHKSISLENGEFTTVKDFKLSAIAKITEVKILTKTVSINPDVHYDIKLTHDPVFRWQLIGADLQVLREPLNPQTKEQPTLKFKTQISASIFAKRVMAKVKEIKEANSNGLPPEGRLKIKM